MMPFWVGLLLGVLSLVLAYFSWAKPQTMLRMSGRNLITRLWLKMAGEEKTLKVIRYVSAPLLLMMGISFLVVGVVPK